MTQPASATPAEVEFHTGVADPVGFVCRLLRKAHRRGARVLVTAPPALLVELDRALWTFDEREFVPHLRLPGPPADTARRTPIWLVEHADRAGVTPLPPVRVNVGGEAVAALGGVERLIEIVAAEPDAADAGRARWRTYRDAGLKIVHHGAAASRDG